MGREFAEEELEEESKGLQLLGGNGADDTWRILRTQNRWKSAEQCGHHPYPGTHPTAVTSERDWGGWVPGAEYDLDPNRIERQAQIIVQTSILVKLLRDFVQYADSEAKDLDENLITLAQTARRVLDGVPE